MPLQWHRHSSIPVLTGVGCQSRMSPSTVHTVSRGISGKCKYDYITPFEYFSISLMTAGYIFLIISQDHIGIKGVMGDETVEETGVQV